MIVCLHGFAQRPDSWLGLLPAGVKAVAPKLPGHAGAPAVASFAEAIEALAPRLQEGCAVAGYSLGARLALALCLRYPERIERALLVSVSPGIEDETERAARRAWDDEQAAALEREGLDRFMARWETLPIFATQDRAMRAAQREARRSHDAGALARSMRSLGHGRMPPLWESLSRCSVPLRLVAGGADPKYRAIAEKIVAVAPQASLHVVADRGHNLLVEAPEVIRGELSNLARAL